MKPWEEYQQESTSKEAPQAANIKPWEEYAAITESPSGMEVLQNIRSKVIKEITNRADAARLGATDMATFGFGDEIYGGLKSLTRDASRGIEKSLYGDNTLSPVSYAEATNAARERNKKVQEANPISYGAGGLVGLGLTGGAAAETALGRQVIPRIGAGNALSRIVKGGVASAIPSAIYGAGSATEGKRLASAGENAISGGLIGAAIPGAGATVNAIRKGSNTAIKGAFAKSTDDIDNIVSDIRENKVNKNYAILRDEGAKIGENKTNLIFSKIDEKLAKRGKLNPTLHSKTIAIVQDLKDAAENGVLDLETLDQQRRVLSRVRPTIDNLEDAGMARAAVKAIDSIKIDPKDLTKGTIKAVDALLEARAEAHKAIKIEKIGDMLRRADGDPNRIKAEFTRFINKKQNLRGFSDEEKEMVINAARTSAPEKILKMAGKFGIDLGTSLTPGNTALPLISGAAANPLIPVIGTAARQLQKYMARGKADEVIRQLQYGSIPKEIGKLPPKIAQEIINEVKLLPAPQKPQQVTMIDSKGYARPMLESERARAESARIAGIESGLTPDVRAVQVRNARNRGFEGAEKQRNAIKEQQLQEIERQGRPSVSQMVKLSKLKSQELQKIIGRSESTTLGEALIRAVEKKKAGNK